MLLNEFPIASKLPFNELLLGGLLVTDLVRKLCGMWAEIYINLTWDVGEHKSFQQVFTGSVKRNSKKRSKKQSNLIYTGHRTAFQKYYPRRCDKGEGETVEVDY